MESTKKRNNTWFLTTIATGMDSIGNPTLNVKCQRTFGYFHSFLDAHEAIAENRGEMHEHLYDLLVLEEIQEGIHGTVMSEAWFKWNYDLKCWKPCAPPKDFEGFTNWALG